MKPITLLGSMASLLFMAACTPPSIEPFYTEKNLVRDPSLPGFWQNSKTGEAIQFIAAGESYECIYTQRGGAVARFNAAFFDLRGRRYLDLYPLDRAPESNDLRELAYVPTHILFRTIKEDDNLRMSMLDPDWLTDKLAEKVYLDHSFVRLVPVLTGPTVQIEAFLASHGDDPAAFSQWSEWRRVPVRPPSSIPDPPSPSGRNEPANEYTWKKMAAR